MSTDNQTFVTETATHQVVTVINPNRAMGAAIPPITHIVRAGFEAGLTRLEIEANIRKFHPNSAAVKPNSTHVQWYASKKKGTWVMNGPWAPKQTAQPTAEELIEQNNARIAELEAMLAAQA
jgi:hypothetical protein